MGVNKKNKKKKVQISLCFCSLLESDQTLVLDEMNNVEVIALN